ncbi:radical SAM family heme chaperone HemW [uncultured Sphaerochaeta sp.]|uniref:radical SAM family heme chaperone HemW n=1 Tax=uncultured Sphaerochaeta sp. TaxID=886478 RepID=UPI002A0A4405|nr:radical SAM family heme chaperone HemW [uncultured Sphaerochaeta sp.]
MDTFLSVEELSLYVHIPFCTSCCSYCAFYSEPENFWLEYREAYVARLEQEICQYADSLGQPFVTIFFGGGNPGCLSFSQLERLLLAATTYGLAEECTVEMNPESFRDDLFPLFEKKLITRLSMGIQSMNPTTLKRLGRNASREENLQGIALANKVHALYGTDLSFDLMTCIPGQTIAQAITDIDTVVSLSKADHISLYCLTIEEGTALANLVDKNLISLLHDDFQAEMLTSCWNHLASLGYGHYEISNFSKLGKRCLHNLRYWELKSYIGLGSSAASTLVKNQQVMRITQEQDLKSFSSSAIFSGYRTETLSSTEQMEEYLLMALRSDEGISKEQFSMRFFNTFDFLFENTIKTLDKNWFFDTPYSFSLQEEGMLFLDDITLRLAMSIS